MNANQKSTTETKSTTVKIGDYVRDLIVLRDLVDGDDKLIFETRDIVKAAKLAFPKSAVNEKHVYWYVANLRRVATKH